MQQYDIQQLQAVVQEKSAFLQPLKSELGRIIAGQEHLLNRLLLALVADGHVLLEGVPGLAKTLAVKTLAQALNGSFSRIQFTPDLLPADLIGTRIYNADEHSFSTKLGPVFANIVLADEINRASPKTQSAMLEAMQEAAVTLLGETRKLPFPFFVLASQNPIEMEGTYPIPEAQLDRFMFKLEVNTVDSATLTDIISSRRRGEAPASEWALSRAELDRIFAVMDQIHLTRPVANYIARLVAASHPGAPEALPQTNEYLAYGASPRAAIAMAEASRAAALLSNRPSVSFDDVKLVAPPVLKHRLILNYKARMDKVTADAVIRELLAKVDVAGIDLPGGVEIQ